MTLMRDRVRGRLVEIEGAEVEGVGWVAVGVVRQGLRCPVTALVALLALLQLVTPARAEELRGRVVDAATGQPIAGALTSNGDVVPSDGQGVFRSKAGQTVRLRAPGYLRKEVVVRERTAVVELEPFSPKALYLSVFGIGTSALREPAIRLIDETELNAVVVDIKGDRGIVPYRSAVPFAGQVGAQDIITIRDVKALLAALKQKGIYTIARIVVFKDNPLAQYRPDLAVKSPTGRLWRDRENLAWADPFRREVWDYNVALAVEAARHGFDEIQFDYVRFPDALGLAYSQASTEPNRARAIEGFLDEARRRLVPYNVFLAADVFGYVCWNPGDTGIGQALETLVSHLDYVSPMLYPSAYQFGIPGYRNPVAHPYEIVSLTLARARERTGLRPCASGPGCRRSRTTRSTAGGSGPPRSEPRSARPAGGPRWRFPHRRGRGSTRACARS
jgi:hypothetical protein